MWYHCIFDVSAGGVGSVGRLLTKIVQLVESLQDAIHLPATLQQSPRNVEVILVLAV